jgi:hypothetical protein
MNQLPDQPIWWTSLGVVLLVVAVIAIASHYWPGDNIEQLPDDSDEGYF